MTAKKLTRSHRDKLIELRGRLRVIADEVGNEVQQYAMLITHSGWWQFASPFAMHMDKHSGNIPVVLLPKGCEPQKADDQSGARQPCNLIGDDDGDDEVEVLTPPRIIGLPDETCHVHLSVSGFPVGDESDMGFLYAWDCDTSAHSVSQLTNFSLIHTYRSLLLAGRILPHAPNPYGTARHLPKRPVRNLALVEWACLALAYCQASPDYGFRVDVSVAKRIGDDLIDWNADPKLGKYDPISYLSLSWNEKEGPSKARRELREEWPELIVAKVVPHYPRSLIGPITETLLTSEGSKRQPTKE